MLQIAPCEQPLNNMLELEEVTVSSKEFVQTKLIFFAYLYVIHSKL